MEKKIRRIQRFMNRIEPKILQLKKVRIRFQKTKITKKGKMENQRKRKTKMLRLIPTLIGKRLISNVNLRSIKHKIQTVDSQMNS
jgi:hypothetical protein